MDSKQIEPGMVVVFNGLNVLVAGNAKGWISIELLDGKIKKVRAKALTELAIEESDDEEGGNPMANHLAKYRTRYLKTKSAAGKASMNNGDEVAQALLGLDHIAVALLADELVPLKGTECHLEKYGHLNNGQIRMNSGNKIRGAAKRGEVTATEIDGKWVLAAA